MSYTLIHSILSLHKDELGDSFECYYNHTCRVFNHAMLLSNANAGEQKQLAIASAFHDIGIWTATTFDYLNPSSKLATEYLTQNGLTEWKELVLEIINQHHKLTPYKHNFLAECFRQADLIDLSFGLFKFGISRDQFSQTNRQFPSLGFHRFITKEMLKNIVKHPFNPLPIVKW